MINSIMRLVLYCSFLCLLSCTQHFLFYGNNHFVSCKINCENRLKICTKVCRNNNLQCSAAATELTAKNYAHYLHEQRVKGEFIALQLNSFCDPLQCRKTTCNCQADYRVCVRACKGTIPKYLHQTPFRNS